VICEPGHAGRSFACSIHVAFAHDACIVAPMDDMQTTVIQELRSLHGFGLITAEHCVRCEREVLRHPNIILTGESACEIAERLVEEI